MLGLCTHEKHGVLAVLGVTLTSLDSMAVGHFPMVAHHLPIAVKSTAEPTG